VKKYGMIFASVIFTLLIMLIPNQKVKADTFIHNNTIYDIDSILNDIKKYDSSYTVENYPYISIHPLDNGFNFYMINSIDNYCYDNEGNIYSDIVCINNDKYFLKVFDHGGAYGSLGGFNGLIKYVYNDETNTYTIDYSSGSTNRFYFPGSKTNKNNYYNEYGTLDGFYDGRILYNNFSFLDDITDNSTFVSYSEFDYNSYEFNEIISTNKYSKIEFNFEIPLNEMICIKEEVIDGVITKIEYVCPAVELNYNIFSSDSNGNISKMIFGIPYIEHKYLYDTGTSSVIKSDTISLGRDMSYQYSGAMSLNSDSSNVSYKLVVDLTGLDYYYVNLSFDSNVDYEVTYYEKESEKEYIGSVDLTGKAGVMFIPKQIKEDMLLNFSFYQNEYSIQLRDTYKSDYNILAYYSVGYCDDRDYIDGIPYICNNGTGYILSVEFEKGNSEQSLFIVNRDYPNKDTSIVYYDTRYFEYVIYNTLADTPTFTHPITGEEDSSNSLIDFDTSMTEQDGFFKEMINALNHFKGVIMDIFGDVSYVFTNLPYQLRYFFIAVFSLVLIIFLTRFIL